MFILTRASPSRRIDPGIAPDEITTRTLHLWYRSDLGVTSSGGVVDSWADQSGNAKTLTGTGTGRPAIQAAALNGYDAFRFDGSNDFLDTGSFTALDTGAVSAFCVLSQVSWTNNDYVYTLNNGNQRQVRQLSSTPQLQISGTSANVANVSPALGTFALLESGFLASTSTYQRLNNGSKSTGSNEGGPVNLDRVTIGATAGGGAGLFANVDIVELVVFSDEITDAAELAGLQQYFNARYALWS